jgi:transposase-like protein
MDRDSLREAALAFVAHRTVRRVMPAAQLSVVTAQRICHLFRLAIAAEPRELFAGPVEVDETYIGAQRKNQRLHIRKLYPPKRGHGTQKQPIIGALDRATGTVRVEVMARKLDKKIVLAFVAKSVTPRARVFTDGFPYYRDLLELGYAHEWVDHNTREYVRGDVHTNGIEGFWGVMKRRMGNTGGMRRHRLGLFATELAWRYNHRRESDDEKADLLVGLAIKFGGRI